MSVWFLLPLAEAMWSHPAVQFNQQTINSQYGPDSASKKQFYSFTDTGILLFVTQDFFWLLEQKTWIVHDPQLCLYRVKHLYIWTQQTQFSDPVYIPKSLKIGMCSIMSNRMTHAVMDEDESLPGRN